jgi:hypothetical protein
MFLRLCSLGLVVLAGCTGNPADPAKTNPSESSTKSTVDARSYTISVPNMV